MIEIGRVIMSAQQKTVALPSAHGVGKTPSDHIDSRKSKELVIGFCGAIGSGVDVVSNMVRKDLEKTYQYQVKKIKVSEIIERLRGSVTKSNRYQRYDQLQNKGNDLRKASTTTLAEYVIARISALKGADETGRPDASNIRRAFIVDQLKHPDEIKLLKKVYGNSFYLFGVLSTRSERIKRLTESEEISLSDATKLLERDEDDPDEYGQKVRKSLQYADFFVRHSSHRFSDCQESVKRFIALMLGMPIITPTIDEYAMYQAYTASLRSSCLSRQVGAAIIDSNNHLISTGYNDVPKFGGGLYEGTNDCNQSGERCFEREGQRCMNDYHKDKICDEIINIVRSIIPIDGKKDDLISKVKKSKVRNLLEFSRSIHAEMDAILAAGRKNKSVVGSRLFCTTFPCHNCARHIIAAGIKEVYFIEPYEKSLALSLHDDAITTDENGSDDKVKLIPFEGVAPTKFADLFLMKSERKKDGRMIDVASEKAVPQIEEYLDSRVDYESLTVDYLRKSDKESVKKVMAIKSE